MDSWSYADWQLLPLDAFGPPAHILNAVEDGKPWPAPTLHTKSHPLNKDPDNPHHPLSPRFLFLTTILYRTWGRIRLKHLHGRIDSWKTHHMYGGVKGVGAEDAWYLTSLDFEHAL
eukprot:4999058-Karenia_brevis.AAC.1